MKTDMLVRERLDFKKQAERINQANRRSIEQSHENLVYRSRSGSGIRGAGAHSTGFIDRKDQGQQILGAIDGNLLNPYKIRQENVRQVTKDDIYGEIKSDQV